VVQFCARIGRVTIALVIAPVLAVVLAMPMVWVTVSDVSAAPIYDMRNLLGQSHPFLQTLPPEPFDSGNTPAVQVLRPSSQSPVQPGGGAKAMDGPMKMPQSFNNPSHQAGGRSTIKWQQGTGAASADQKKPEAYKSNSFLSEVRIGALAHDQGPFSSNKEEGYDANLEFLFSSPDFLDIIWSPRPHIGATYNAYGDTSQAYLGLTWEWDFFTDFFGGFSFGASVHDGKKTTLSLDKKELGCRVLFRESLTLGYRFTKKHSIMAFIDHISNAKLCSRNEGLETVGIRYGYRF